MTKNKTNNSKKRPKVVINNLTKLYIATKEITDDNNGDLFFIMSLFLPVKDGVTYLRPQTEIEAYDDAEYFCNYYQTLSHYCAVNAKTTIGIQAKQAIADFYKYTKQRDD